jgi:hypothetical protein
VIGFLVAGSVALVAWQWDRLGVQARALILAAYGVLVLVFLLPRAVRGGKRLRRGAQAQGTVVGVKQTTGAEGEVFYHPRVLFFTPDGRTVEFTSMLGYGREHDVGARVPVRYPLDDPEQAELDTAFTWLLPGAVQLLTGLGLLVAGVVVYLRG